MGRTPTGSEVRRHQRVAAGAFRIAPSWVVAAALMPFARSGENVSAVRRIVKLWQKQPQNKERPAK
jgi:hypothetical protein